jgi:hypothetical protein
MKVFLLAFFLSAIFSVQALDVGIAAVFNDEAPYLKEWIDYHRLIGVKHFYLYNHSSTDDYQNVLKPYIDEELVDLIELNPEYNNGSYQLLSPHDYAASIGFVRNIQPSICQDAIRRAKMDLEWLAIILKK